MALSGVGEPVVSSHQAENDNYYYFFLNCLAWFMYFSNTARQAETAVMLRGHEQNSGGKRACSNFLAVCLTERSSACKQKPQHIVVFTIDCPLTQFHAHLGGDEPHAFNSHKEQMAVLPFPVCTKLLK